MAVVVLVCFGPALLLAKLLYHLTPTNEEPPCTPT